MVSVLLMGGMGNQMFQYALGRSLADEAGVPLHLDTSFLKRRDMPKGFVYRNYDLDLFKVRGNVDHEKKWEKPYTFSERYFHFDPSGLTEALNALKTGRNVFLEGYWQSPKYFQKNEQKIREDFSFEQPIEFAPERIQSMAEKIDSQPSVMVNVRRTDYLNTDFHGVMGQAYIQSAVRKLEEIEPNANYFVFSDDVEWCAAHIKLPNMTLVDHSYKGDRFSYYLQLMKRCRHFIIPNSTFAWWAAWLNTNTDQLVYAPKQWFTDSSIRSEDLIPTHWIRI